MRKTRLCILAALATVFSSAALTAHAEPAAPFSGIDPNTFILGHPASPRWKVVHSNGEHPAVLVARRAQQSAQLSSIDPNQFIVQPPASVRWLVRGDSEVTTAAATSITR